MLSDSDFPVLLALDTSTDRAAIGLKQGDSCAELMWPAGRSQTTSLLPAIDWLLATNGLSSNDVAAVAVATGPGTFTGLRVGMSLAKGLVLARDIPLIGIPTLDVAAFPYRSVGVSVVATLPAGRSRVVWAVSDQGERLSSPVNSTVPELVEMLAAHPDLLVIGELLPEHRDMVAEAHGRIEPISLNARRPAVLAELAWDRWRSGDVDDATLLEPTYVHGPRATTAPIIDRLVRKSQP